MRQRSTKECCGLLPLLFAAFGLLLFVFNDLPQLGDVVMLFRSDTDYFNHRWSTRSVPWVQITLIVGWAEFFVLAALAKTLAAGVERKERPPAWLASARAHAAKVTRNVLL